LFSGFKNRFVFVTINPYTEEDGKERSRANLELQNRLGGGNQV
jgi:hypothetical protein